METKPSKLFHRVSQVALMFDVSRSGAYKLIETGELEAVRIGKSLRVPAEAIERFKNRKVAEGRA